MAETDTLNPEAKETSSPKEGTVETDVTEKDKQNIQDQAKKQNNINIDTGREDEEAIDDTSKTGAWYDNLGADYKNDPDITKYKSLEEYVKGNREVRKLVGKEKIVLPGEKSTPEEVNAFYEKLGRPKELTGYSVPQVENVPEEVKVSDTDIEAYRKKAFELGLTKKQFEELYAFNIDLNVNKFNNEVEKVSNLAAEAETELRGEWGNAYEVKVDGAQKVINKFFKNQKMHQAFSVLANDKGFIRAMANIAENLGEDAIAGEPRYTLTPQEAQKEHDAIIAGNHELSKAYFDDLSPEHQTAVDRVLALQTMASAATK